MPITTILLAEDYEILRSLVSRALALAGYTVLPAHNGRDAFRVFLRHIDEVDILVTDFEMPYMNGLQLASAVAELRPKIEIIIMSGNSEDAELQTAGWRRMNKPFLPSDLVRTVTLALRSGRIAA